MGKKMKRELIGILICMLLITTVLPVSGTLMVEKSSIQTINDGSLSGYVNDSSMNAIEGARVRVYFHGTYEENYTDANGYYHVANIPICYCLKNCTVLKEWYHPNWVMMGITENTTYDFILIPLNSSGIDPPYGPTEGYVNVPYTFYFDIPVDPQGDTIYLQWCWGDGKFSDWLGPYSGGETASASHEWVLAGNYYIVVNIKNIHGNINTSDPLIIHIYEGANLIIFPGKIHGGIGKVKARIDNVGDKDAINVKWCISIEGGILGKINITTIGHIDILKAGNSELISTDTIIIGFGGVGITVTAQAESVEEVTQQIIGFVILFYVYTPPIFIG